jgi:hypothetical protein
MSLSRKTRKAKSRVVNFGGDSILLAGRSLNVHVRVAHVLYKWIYALISDRCVVYEYTEVWVFALSCMCVFNSLNLSAR